MHGILHISLAVGLCVFAATVLLDFLHVLFVVFIVSGRRVLTATTSMLWRVVTMLLITVYLHSLLYLGFAAAGIRTGAFLGMKFRKARETLPPAAHDASGVC